MDKAEPPDQHGTIIQPSNIQAGPAESTTQNMETPPELLAPSSQGSDLDLSTSLTWTAPEFAGSDKSFAWYFVLLIAAAAVAALLYLLTKDFVTVSVVVVVAVILSILAAHKPKDVEYRLDQQGIGIGTRTFAYGDFRSFSTVAEGNLTSVILMPLKRFAVPYSIYFSQADQDKVLSMLSERLPFERHRPDVIDRVLRTLHI